MRFVFIKRLETAKNSIFYSLIKRDGEILGFGRNHYGSNDIKQIKLDESFNIIEDTGVLFTGEDPRCFNHKDRLYVLNNRCHMMHLIHYEEKRYVNIDIVGKNISFISRGDTLYFIHYIKPFQLYKVNVENGHFERVEVDDDQNEYGYEYRGGTPGYKLNETQYYGLGHRTYHKGGIVTHDIFKWIVTFDPERPPRIEIVSVEQPPNSKNICDPTCVFELNGKKYVVTAETEHVWNCEQDYITNLYEISE